VESIIGHAKHDNRMVGNYLKGTDGDKMNAVLAESEAKKGAASRPPLW